MNRAVSRPLRAALLGSTLFIGATATAAEPASLPVAQAGAGEDHDLCAEAREAIARVQGDDRRQRCAPRRALSVTDDEQIAPNTESARNQLTTEPFRISIDGEWGGDGAAADGPGDAERRSDLRLALAGAQFTFDALNAKPVLNVRADRVSAHPGDIVQFLTFWNYPDFITRGEVRLFAPGADVLGEPTLILDTDSGTWKAAAQVGSTWRYVLRVYGADGAFDETTARDISIVAPQTPIEVAMPDVIADDTTATRNIRVRGGTATLRIASLPAGATVTAWGKPVLQDVRGVAFAQRIVPRGAHEVIVTITGGGQGEQVIERTFELGQTPDVGVFFADVTAGYRGGDRDPVASAGPDSDPERDYVEGRLAFYVDRQLDNGLRVVASADTKEREIDELFVNFDRRDGRSIIRRLDPDRTWPVYGDDSTTVDNAPTSGRFYIRAEQDQSYVQWGDFQTHLGGPELTNYARSLYGAQASLRGDRATQYGEAAQRLEVFAAEPGTTPGRDEFRATGGSVYFLRRQDVNEGSERIFVEVRDRDSGLVTSRRELVPGTDYDLNYLQGRLFLREPLESTRASAQAVRDGALSGDPVYLVVGYEYSPGLTQSDAFAAGGRAHVWLNDHFGVGATGYRQGEAGERQTLLGLDMTLRYRPGTYLKTEFGQSTGTGTQSLTSGTGGYDFATLSTSGARANAHRVEAGIDLADMSPGARGQIGVYWQDREQGYSAPGQFAPTEDLSQAGVTMSAALDPRTGLRGKLDTRDGDISAAHVAEVSIDHAFTNGVGVGVGVRVDDRQSTAPLTASPTLNAQGERTDVIATISYSPQARAQTRTGDKEWEIRGFIQETARADAGRQENDRVGMGGAVRLTERAKLSGEVSDGDLGFGARADLNYDYSDRGTLYLGYHLAGENPDSFDAGRLGRLTAGTRLRYSDSVGVFAEGRYVHGAGPTGFTQSYGIDLRPAKSWATVLSFETGALSDPTSGDIDRDAISGTVSYQAEGRSWSGTLEWREDTSAQSGNRTVWAWRSLATMQATPAWRLFAKVSGANTEESQSAALEADFLEATLAGAYRPVLDDRWNTLFKYTYIADLPSAAQVNAGGLPVDFAQRGHVLSVDTNRNLNGWLTVGGRYAYKIAELRQSRDESAPWFDSRVQYVAVRVDVAFIKEWNAMIEARTLDVLGGDSNRVGAVTTLHRSINDNVRLGVGYNFADFSDDLTDLSGTSHGWFVNVVGAW